MGTGRGFLRALLGALAFVGFIWFLLVEILASVGTRTSPWTGNFKHLEAIGSWERTTVYPDFDSSYMSMSKRGVPNGPDPIHNRRAGKSRQPPGQA